MQPASKLAAGIHLSPISIINTAANNPELVPTGSEGKIMLSQSSSLKPIGDELNLHNLTYTIDKTSAYAQTNPTYPTAFVQIKLEDELERVACRSMN